MPTFMLTFNPHITEKPLLDTFCSLLWSSTFFTDLKEYYYNIEKPDSPGAHLHLFFTSSHRDKEKVKLVFQKTEWTSFWKSLKIKETDGAHAINVVLVGKNKSRNDRQYYLGYVQKNITKVMPAHYPLETNIDTLECISAYEYYIEYSMIQLKEKKPYSYKVLTSKNVYDEIRTFIDKNDLILDHLIWDRLSAECIMSDFISQNQKDSIVRSMSISLGYELQEKAKYLHDTFQDVYKPIIDTQWLGSAPYFIHENGVKTLGANSTPL